MIHGAFNIPAAIKDRFQQAQLCFEKSQQSSFYLACELGDALAAIKAEVPHGSWKQWVGANCRFKLRRAQDFMQLAGAFDTKARKSAHLNLDEALRSIRKKKKPRAFAHDRLSREALVDLHDASALLSQIMSNTIFPILDEEGVTKSHQLHQDAAKLRAAISRMRNRVDDQLDGYRDPGCPPHLIDALDTLDLTWPCTADELEAAYRREVQTHHPDKGGSHADFLRVQKAYEAIQEELAAVA